MVVQGTQDCTCVVPTNRKFYILRMVESLKDTGLSTYNKQMQMNFINRDVAENRPTERFTRN